MVVERVAAHRVDAEQHRDAQACVQRGLLHLARVVAQHMQKRARAPPGPGERLLAAHLGIGNLNHLGDLFLQRHLRQQRFHP